MSAELMYSSSDENTDFQKQIGCMNGLFRHFLGSPCIATPNHETPPPGSNGKHRAEINKIASPRRKQSNLKNTVKEKQRLSFESPRSSLSSSSCLSSYSSADCTKTSRVDEHRSSSSQTSLREIPKQEISNDQSMVSWQPSKHWANLRYVVKYCINREIRRLSVKTATKVDAGQNRTMKHIDSPRPLQSPKPAMTGLDKSSHDVSELREVPKTANGHKVGSLDFVPKDARRFSYDERGSRDAVKVKLKDDQRRLSLDSREISMKGSSSVVAKLMGLEISPDPKLVDSNQCFRIKTFQDLQDDPRSLSSRIDENKKTQVTCSPRNSTKEPSSPLSINTNSEKRLALRPGSPNGPSGRQRSRDKTTSGTLRIKATLKELSPIARENEKLAMSSVTTYIKLQQKTLESEKQPRLTSPASDKSRSRRQSSRLQAKPGSPHWKSRHKCHNSQCSDDTISDINCDMKDLSHQGDAGLIKFERNTSAGAIGVTSTDRSYKIEGSVSQKHEKNHKNPTTEPPSTVMEQPSPVSVLDATFYEDESLSPVKKNSNAFKDYEGLIGDDAEWSPIGLNDKQLIFDDAVNEILLRKLEKESSYESCVSTIMVEDKTPKSHQVVRDLCSDIDKLRSASNISLDNEIDSQQSTSLGDLMVGSMDWSKCSSEFPGVVLDVERLIFKDLICEVISSEAANPQG